jgi:hypothetical protein
MTSVGFPLYSEGPRQKVKPLVETLRQASKRRKGGIMNDTDSVGGYSVPVDPMDDLQCESCQ